ncbi:hypothetical protein LPUS_08841 [Lasallia pustulata]|uniref:Uncharacterized protein n=1 Tax=Lasallia pustulata TaxID=136370 RepID=A0A1W5D621_9LECA|nr:hypothetical protein LPUS_08841 [Lasallia pustulata]
MGGSKHVVGSQRSGSGLSGGTVIGCDGGGVTASGQSCIGGVGDVRKEVGTRTDIVLADDFNRHDQLWGGDSIATTR